MLGLLFETSVEPGQEYQYAQYKEPGKVEYKERKALEEVAHSKQKTPDQDVLAGFRSGRDVRFRGQCTTLFLEVNVEVAKAAHLFSIHHVMQHLPVWYKRGPSSDDVLHLSCSRNHSQASSEETCVVTTRCYLGQPGPDRYERIARVTIARIPVDYQEQVEQLVAIHAVHWQLRGLWDFDLAQYAIIYGFSDLVRFLSSANMEPPLFSLTMPRMLEAVLLNGSESSARAFLHEWPNWRDKVDPKEEMRLMWRFYGSARDTELYDANAISTLFKTGEGLVDQQMLEHVKNPSRDDLADDFVMDQIDEWLGFHYNIKAFTRGMQLLIPYWKALYPQAPIRLSTLSEEDEQFTRLQGSPHLLSAVQMRPHAFRIIELIEQIYIDDIVRPKVN